MPIVAVSILFWKSVCVGEREQQRKWMSFKPLISTWTRDGQAYETVALKHWTSRAQIFISFTPYFFTPASRAWIKTSLSVTVPVTISVASQCAITSPGCLHVTHSMSCSIKRPHVLLLLLLHLLLYLRNPPLWFGRGEILNWIASSIRQ